MLAAINSFLPCTFHASPSKKGRPPTFPGLVFNSHLPLPSSGSPDTMAEGQDTAGDRKPAWKSNGEPETLTVAIWLWNGLSSHPEESKVLLSPSFHSKNFLILWISSKDTQMAAKGQNRRYVFFLASKVFKNKIFLCLCGDSPFPQSSRLDFMISSWSVRPLN